ncbi:MAG: hypothetical protein IJT44_04795 [Clostridia bacterium]|nr:hypothetical protein [Clostridia bacterium]
MEEISGLLFGFCFAAALGAIVRLLAPGGSTARLLRLCAALFVLSALMRPAAGILRALPVPSVRDNAQAAADAVRENVRLAIEQTARKALDAHGFTDAQIYVRTHTEDGEVHAEAFRISGVPAADRQEIANEIFALTGERPVMEDAP